ncbi:branched-chain amino acid ABC transporter permease (plasmid) [Deinococcus metallilatus]|uniref:Branched-chain amino acid ABC transporter permease n=1 Tax=Deinococcus metallilatus TaxID=1211322 RepID=A0AAJ5JZV2_9DEIO|nr:branched-chain amino acid ABC transporter permease [Deinococcus metallilatus]MBB5293380.1 branched-chain amino acid transport system permease protein [Deinococcus metallilatus]QBY06479.1 branched-chain amino acid ABC transporter permease [Deinococcus metallilatus]RXJ17822.1 branched-chain amino acid ABC transporter permease [Deinococcus metallilatus]TLK32094.1 branched-chain amino acid ABC transporter permease [Deinococcus metallilatus]GMA15397.1 branched-chain amino acid ABC transporter pe
MQLILFQLLNSLAFGMLLFLLSAGFSLIFGVARVANLAHGAFYVLSAYIGYTVAQASGNFWLGVLIATLAGALLGVIVERTLISRLRGHELRQVLLTLGLAFVIADAVRFFWGADIKSVSPPAPFEGPITLGGLIFPSYPFVLTVLGLAVFGLIRLVLRRTLAGAQIRAVTADPQMSATLGLPVARISMLTFAAGIGLAAFGGAVGSPQLALTPTLDSTMTLYALIVVVIGGLGSIEGAFLAAILVGLVNGFGAVYFPAFAQIAVFALMILVIAVRPQGLLGRRLGAA